MGKKTTEGRSGRWVAAHSSGRAWPGRGAGPPGLGRLGWAGRRAPGPHRAASPLRVAGRWLVGRCSDTGQISCFIFLLTNFSIHWMVLACSNYYCGGFLLVIFCIYLFFYINWNFMRNLFRLSHVFLLLSYLCHCGLMDYNPLLSLSCYK